MKLVAFIITAVLSMLSLCVFAEDKVETIEVPKETFDAFTNRVTMMWGYIHESEDRRCAFHGGRVNQVYDFDRAEPVLIITYEDGFKFEIKIPKGNLESDAQTMTVKALNKPKLMSIAQWNAQVNNTSKTVRVLRSIKFGPGGKIIFTHDTVEK